MADDDVSTSSRSDRRQRSGGRPGQRERPKMPSTRWRVWAIVCFAAGALAGALVFGSGGAVLLRILLGGGLGMAIGMIVVEAMWERRHRTHDEPRAPDP